MKQFEYLRGIESQNKDISMIKQNKNRFLPINKGFAEQKKSAVSFFRRGINYTVCFTDLGKLNLLMVVRL
jgi:hypothetical protein